MGALLAVTMVCMQSRDLVGPRPHEKKAPQHFPAAAPDFN